MARTGSGRVRLPIVLEDEDGTVSSWLMDFRSDATVRDLLIERTAASANVEYPRFGITLPPTMLLRSAQIRPGDTLKISTSPAPLHEWSDASNTDYCRLVTEAGPQLGRVWPLAAQLEARFLLDSEGTGLLALGEAARSKRREELADRELRFTQGEVGQSLYLSSGSALRLWIDGTELDSTTRTEVPMGGLLEIADDSEESSESRLALRLADPASLDALPRSGGIAYRVSSASESPTLAEPRRQRLAEMPRPGEETPLWELLVQEMPILAVYVLLYSVGARSPVFLVFLLLPLMRLLLRLYRRRTDRQRQEQALAQWFVDLDREVGLLSEAAASDLHALRHHFPGWTDLARSIDNRSATLWQRNWRDRSPFGQLLVGYGLFRSDVELSISGPGSDADLADARRRAEWARTAEGAPLAVDFADGVAIVAPKVYLATIARQVVLRTAASFSPSQVAFGFLLPASETRDRPAQYDFVRWLPHTSHATAALPAGFRVSLSPSESNQFLQDLLDSRIAERTDDGSQIVLFVHEAAGASLTLLNALLSSAANVVNIVWLGHSERVPALAKRSAVFRLDPELNRPRGELLPRRGGMRSLDPEGVSTLDAERVAQRLAALIDEGSTTIRSEIPPIVPLATLIESTSDVSAALEAAWLSNTTEDQLQASLGMWAGGVFELDLVQKGPHILIGGTTNSGKSELLRTLIGSLAARYGPSELALFLVDFKGGASLRDLGGLPHAVASATSLDSAAGIDRVLRFLRAEIRRREQLLAAFQGEFKRYRAAGHSMARLLVVVDEFAFFSDQKGAETAMLNVAARGRSLGVHLVIATQRIQGTVSPQIRANVAARIALRTLDPQDSISVIDGDEASRIPSELQGRAFIRDEAANALEFQAGFSASTYWSNLAEQSAVVFHRFDFASNLGRASLNGDELPSSSRTDLAILIDTAIALSKAAEAAATQDQL